MHAVLFNISRFNRKSEIKQAWNNLTLYQIRNGAFLGPVGGSTSIWSDSKSGAVIQTKLSLPHVRLKMFHCDKSPLCTPEYSALGTVGLRLIHL